MNKILFLFLLIFLGFKTEASTIVFDCSVKNFTTRDSSEKTFIKNNYLKRFLISMSDEEIIVTVVSDGSFNSSVNKYNVYRTDSLGSVYALTPNMFGNDVIVINPDTQNATISLQGDFYLNAWFLECDKQQ